MVNSRFMPSSLYFSTYQEVSFGCTALHSVSPSCNPLWRVARYSGTKIFFALEKSYKNHLKKWGTLPLVSPARKNAKMSHIESTAHLILTCRRPRSRTFAFILHGRETKTLSFARRLQLLVNAYGQDKKIKSVIPYQAAHLKQTNNIIVSDVIAVSRNKFFNC